MTAPTPMPSTPPAIIRAAQDRCLAMSENGELTRRLVVITATPGPDAMNADIGDLRTARYEPESLDECVARLSAPTTAEAKR